MANPGEFSWIFLGSVLSISTENYDEGKIPEHQLSNRKKESLYENFENYYQKFCGQKVIVFVRKI